MQVGISTQRSHGGSSARGVGHNMITTRSEERIGQLIEGMVPVGLDVEKLKRIRGRCHIAQCPQNTILCGISPLIARR